MINLIRKFNSINFLIDFIKKYDTFLGNNLPKVLVKKYCALKYHFISPKSKNMGEIPLNK